MFFKKKDKPAIPVLSWHKLECENGPNRAYRTKVPGGWLMTVKYHYMESIGGGVTFIPDPNHEWDGYSLDYEEPKVTHCVKCNYQTTRIIDGEYNCGFCK